MRRRFEAYKQQPKLVKLMGNLGVDQNYTIEKGYRYFDLLVVGGGGGGEMFGFLEEEKDGKEK